jgi:hypothetical protein
LIAAFLAAAVFGGDFESWNAIGDAELCETNGDYDGAIRIYEHLARTLTEDDPDRAEALFRVGNLYRRLGRADDAATAFAACLGTRSWHTRCLDASTDLAIDKSAVTSLPVVWTFDDDHHGLVHPGDSTRLRSRIGIPRGGGDPALLWTTRLLRDETGELEVGIATGDDALAGVSFEVRALGGSAWLRLRAEDEDGRWFATVNPLRIAPGTARIVDIDVATLLPVDGGTPLVPSHLHRLVLQDTGLQDPNVVERTLILDDFTLY